jgi:hypothetical protein
MVMQYGVDREQCGQYLQTNFTKIPVFQGIFKTMVAKISSWQNGLFSG